MTSPNARSFKAQLLHASTADRFRLTKAWQKAKTESARQQVQQQLEKSKSAVKQRQQLIPNLTYPDLPVSAMRETIVDTIRNNQVIVLCGDTGSGKTTQLPKLALEAGQGTRGLIGHTQPRRIAARNVAARIAEELGVSLGNQVGFKIRFTDQVSKQSLIKVMTDGILLAETQQDRFLDAYDTIIIDEAHERSLNIDFLLGYLKNLLKKRTDLKVIITSATIDPARFAEHFQGSNSGIGRGFGTVDLIDKADKTARVDNPQSNVEPESVPKSAPKSAPKPVPMIQVPGRTYPVDLVYLPPEDNVSLVQSVLDGVAQATQLDKHGDMLIFLPTERDIRECTEAINRQNYRYSEVLPLFARLAPGDQQKIFNPGQQRRIVLSTNVAETSLTVPRIKFVIDSGLARLSRYSWRSKLQRLPIERISKASADQRKGRCGRIGPGICIRLYSQEDYETRPEFTEPEIQRTNLASVILQMHSLHLGDLSAFPFIDPPDSRFVTDGERLLQELGALHNDKLTKIGQQLARFPVDPVLARMLVAAEKQSCLKEMLPIIAVLSIADPRERPQGAAAKADEKQNTFNHPRSDFLSFYQLWLQAEEARESLSNSAYRRWCNEHYLNYLRMREWRDIHHQLTVMAKALKLTIKSDAVYNPKDEKLYGQIHQAILTGLPSHIGLRDDTKTKPKTKVNPKRGRGVQVRRSKDYLATHNAGFQLWPGSSVFANSPKWVVYLERMETARVYGRVLAEVKPDWIEEAAKNIIQKSYFEPHYNAKTGRVDGYTKVLLRGLVIAEKRRINYASVDPATARDIFIREALVNARLQAPKLPEFWQHNRRLIQQLEQKESKTRRRDLLINDEKIYAWYDERLPEKVVDKTSFDHWIKSADQSNLKFTEADLIQNDRDVNQNDYPEAMLVDGAVLPLEYQFDPGGQADGVTVVASAAVINQIDANRLEWLVPGLLQAKILAAIKALPKRYRRNFVPAPNYAEAVFERISESEEFAQGDLFKRIAYHLFRMTGNQLPDDAWQEADFPDHLKMNVKVVDADVKALRQGRNLESIKKQSAADSKKVFHKVSQQSGHAIEQTGLTNWTFGDLPESVKIKHDSVSLLAYPALVDEHPQSQSVAIKLFDTPDKAQQAHRLGLLRLFRLQLGSTVTYVQKKLPHGSRLELAFANMPSCPTLFKLLIDETNISLINSLLNCVIKELLVNDNIRTQDAFDKALKQEESRIVAEATELTKPLLAALEIYPSIKARLADKSPIGLEANFEDCRTQLEHLVFRGFLNVMPAEKLRHLARYLKALSARLDKITQEPKRDMQRMAEVEPLWQALIKLPMEQPNWWQARWMIEEFRVSLYAQQLGTSGKVSAKRIEKLLQA